MGGNQTNKATKDLKLVILPTHNLNHPPSGTYLLVILQQRESERQMQTERVCMNVCVCTPMPITTFHNVNNEPRVFIGVEEHDVTQGTISQGRAEDGNVVLQITTGYYTLILA